jgi:Ran GTPase-activating protein (RanGAP) involved in mRNA processing and transport
MTVQQRIKEELELAMDTLGFEALMYKLAEICHDKAEHFAANWQDRYSARQYDKLADKLDKLGGEYHRLLGN